MKYTPLLPLAGIVNQVINSTVDTLQTESAFRWAHAMNGRSAQTQCLGWKAFIRTSQGGRWFIS